MIKCVRWVLLLGCMGLLVLEAHAASPMAAGPDLSFGLSADAKVEMWASHPIGQIRSGAVLMVNTVTPSAQADCLFNWAEGAYPTLFAPAGAASITLGPWYYRYYSQTDAYVGTSSADSHVYYHGPNSSYATVDVGPLTSWLATAGCQPTLNLVLLDSIGAITTTLTAVAPLTVQATLKDKTGAAIPNSVISFTSADTTLGVVSPAWALTNATGIAFSRLDAASISAAGASQVT